MGSEVAREVDFFRSSLCFSFILQTMSFCSFFFLSCFFAFSFVAITLCCPFVHVWSFRVFLIFLYYFPYTITPPIVVLYFRRASVKKKNEKTLPRSLFFSYEDMTMRRKGVRLEMWIMMKEPAYIFFYCFFAELDKFV